MSIFDNLPTVTIYGVVGAQGAGASQTPPDTFWQWRLELLAWRLPGGLLQDSSLIVTKSLSDEELKILDDSVAAESVIAFQAKLCEGGSAGESAAQFIQLLDAPQDTELERWLTEYQTPVELNDPLLGKLVLDKSINCFEGSLNWLGKTISIHLSLDENNSATSSLKTMNSLFKDMHKWSQQVEACTVEQLVELKNDCWLDDDEKPISKETFLTRIQLTAIDVEPEGEFTFEYDDDDIFWGHAIVVDGSLTEGAISANIYG